MEDREQRLTEHLAELRRRITRVLILLAVLIPVIFLFSPQIIKILWQELVGGQMFAFGIMEWILLNLTLSLILSLIFLYPYASLELYLFAKPGLYENERKFFKIVLISSYLLFLFGLFISFKFLIPALYSISYGEQFYSVERTLSNSLRIAFAIALSLQIPLAIFLLDHFRIVDYEVMKNFRLPIYLIIFLLILNTSANLSGLAQVLALLLFILMFELGLIILKVSKRYIQRR
ncbi:MAG: twin-arginine translocase subunit TatC [Archaeoglobaceae archaeon]